MKTKHSGVSEKANASDSGHYAETKTHPDGVSENAKILPFGIASRGSFKRQIILTFVVGFFLLTVAFAAYQVKTESAYLYRDSTDETMSLAESLAASSRSWVLANDVAGLQEVVHAFEGHPGFRYAMIISPAGRVLAHSDATKIGQFVTDEQSLALIKAPLHSRIMIDDESLVDIAVPIMADQRHVGWARAGQGREGIVGYLHNMMLSSALFVLMAVILSLFAALLIANRLGYRIGNLMRVAEAVQAGNYATRANISGADEIAKLADSLNQMLDELVRNEKELRAASLYTRRLIEASLDPLVTISPEGKITDVNMATEEATGRSRSELIATDFSDYFTEPDKAREGYQQVFAQGFVTDYPLALRHRDGHVTDVLYNASVYRDEANEVLGVFAAARNVTERKKAEQEVVQLSLRNRLILDSAGEGIYGLDIDGRCTFVNPAALQSLGFGGEELIGQPSHSMFHHTRPDGRPYPQEECPVQAAYKQGAVHRGEDLYWRKDGSSFPVEFISTPIMEAGEITGAVVTFRDITERKQAEEALYEAQQMFRSLVENSPDIITRYDRDCRRTYVNPTYLKVAQIPQQELLGIAPMQHSPLPTGSAEALQHLLNKVLDSGVVEAIDVMWTRADNINHWYNIYAFPEFDREGRVMSVMTVSRDITGLKEAENKITELNRDLERRVVERTAQLEAANKELEAFSYSVSHDLRTPLRAIDGFSRILLDDYNGKLDDEGKRLLNVVRDNTSRMGQLIDDILKFSRTGRLELTFTDIDMEKLAHEVYEELQPSVAGGKLQLEIEAIPPARGDRAMMRQIFVNLLTNAIKFSRSREPARIKVGGSIAGDEAIYYVKDNGVGFDMQYADKLFGVFQRLHGVTEFEGTGIGLAIVKRVITRHGGRVWAEGKVGEGATIYFVLPTKEKEHG